MSDGRFKKGERRSPATEFKKGQHWRKPQAFREREWLQREYVEKQRSAGEIAAEFGVRDASIYFWLKRHGIPRRTVRQARALKNWGLSGAANGMYGRTGAKSPAWRGGISPARQVAYSSIRWADAVKAVWDRDKGVCQRCGVTPKRPNIHHIIKFEVEETRFDPVNLVTLCSKCHGFVHSKANVHGEFKKGGMA